MKCNITATFPISVEKWFKIDDLYSAE